MTRTVWALTLGFAAFSFACSSDPEGDKIGQTHAQGGAGNQGGGQGQGGDLFATGGTGTGTTGGGSGLGGGPVCGAEAKKAEAMPVDMYIMFDQSTSMNDPIPGSASRWWDAAVQAVGAFVNDPRAAGIGVGIQFFPYGNQIAPGSCTGAYSTPEVPIGVLPGQAGAIIGAVNGHGPSGFTPSGPALQGAIDHMKQWGPAHPGRAPVVVFVTDGFPTECEPSQISDIAAVAKAAAETEPRVRVFVVGFTAGLSNLNSIAQAGGTGDAFLIEGGNVSEQFVQAMLGITGTALQCNFPVPTPPAGMEFNIDKVAVGYIPNATQTREEVPRLRNLGDCAINSNNGWYYDHPTQPTELLVCPGTCNRFAAGVVNIEYGCDPVRGKME